MNALGYLLTVGAVVVGALAVAVIVYLIWQRFFGPRVICAWCGKDMGPSRYTEADTHGICERCMVSAMKEFKDAREKVDDDPTD